MAKDINIGGRLHSIATGNVVAGTDEILDDNLGKKQTQINTETYSLVESVNNALAELSPNQQEALAVAAKANANEAKLGYYVCDTGANIAAKTVVATNYVLGTGGSIKVKMTNDNTVNNATLNINSTGAKPLFYEGARASSTNTWTADDVLEIYYDGTNYQAKNVSPTFKTGEKVSSVGVDDVPTAGSENLVKSGGVFDLTKYGYIPKKNSSIIEKVQNWDEHNYISNNTTKWDTSNIAKSTIFNITDCKLIRINLLDDSCRYAFLKSLSFESGTKPDYATNSSITVKTDIKYIDLEVPNDAQYLYVLDKYSNNLYRTNIELILDDFISLQYAISLIPEERQVGYLTIKFLDEDNKVSIYQLQASYWSTNLTKWKKILNLDDLSGIKKITDLIEIPDIPAFYYSIERADLDYPIQGYYSQNENNEQIIISNNKTRSTQIITVQEGSIIKLHNWTFASNVQIIAAYDLDNLPYDGNSCRINGNLFTDLGDGEYEYTLPANAEKISILLNIARINLTDGAYFEILNPSGQEIILDDRLKKAINECVDIDNVSSTHYVAEMYHKGASPKSYNAQKDLGIIIAGQSNADGRAPIEDLQTQIEFPITNVHICTNDNGTFGDYNRPSTQFGFDLPLLNQVGAIDNTDVYGIKYAVGGTSISDKTAKTSVWTVFYEKAIKDGKTSLLKNLENRLRNALNNNPNVEIRAFCWHQGESDGNYSLEVANDYYNNLRYLVSYVRGVVGNSRLPFIFGNISLNASSTVSHIDVINAAFDRIVETDPYAMLIDMKGAPLKSDNLHFNAASQEYLGKMMHDCLIDMGVINATKVNPIRPW